MLVKDSLLKITLMLNTLLPDYGDSVTYTHFCFPFASNQICVLCEAGWCVCVQALTILSHGSKTYHCIFIAKIDPIALGHRCRLKVKQNCPASHGIKCLFSPSARHTNL